MKRHNRRFSAFNLVLAFASLTACGDEANETLPGTRQLCDPIDATDVVIQSQADLDRIVDQDEVDGDLIICSASDLTLVALPALERIGGNLLFFENESATTVHLPLLVETGFNVHARRGWDGILIDANAALREVKMPLLRSVHQHIWIADNPELPAIDFPSLLRTTGSITFKATQLTAIDGFASVRTIGNSLTFVDNEHLETITGFGAVSILSNDLYVANNPALTTITLSEARVLGRRLTVTGAPLLGTLDVPLLSTVGHDIELVGTSLVDLSGLAAVEQVGTEVAITENGALTSVSLPALTSTGSSIQIEHNDLATSVELPAAAWIGADLRIRGNSALTRLAVAADLYIGGDLRIDSNSVLPTCAAEAVHQGAADIAGSVSITGNDDGGSCP